MLIQGPADLVLVTRIGDGMKMEAFKSARQLVFESLEGLSDEEFSKFAKNDWPNLKAIRKEKKWLRKFPF